MKKKVLLLLVFALFAEGAMAQKPASRNKSKLNSVTTTVDGKRVAAASVADAKEVIKLPAPEVGLDVPLIEAFQNRRTVRELSDKPIPEEILSSLLWSAYGFNRPEESRRVVPSAVNVQEFDIYLFNQEGIYLYDAKDNVLRLVKKGDFRFEISEQKHFAVAPVSILIVANYDRMKVFKEKETRDFYASVDAGYVSQNIYLFCAANNLGTVACGGIDREGLQKTLELSNGRVILAHPVGLIQ